MLNIQITLSHQTQKELNALLQSARELGDLRMTQRILAIQALSQGQDFQTVADILQVCQEALRLWVRNFLLNGPPGLRSKKSPGRPPKLTKTQKKRLDSLICEGPAKAGYPGACWRAPLIQDLIYREFGVFYSVHYLSQLLRHMGFSYQKARLVSDHLDEKKRQQWIQRIWPKILRLAKKKKALILFGDEASFPQWGTLSYTWAKKGQQPTVKTSGLRKAYKVFGLIDYFTGQFFYKAHEGRLNSKSYQEFLRRVLAKTKQYIILIQDGARYHTSQAMREFFATQTHRLTVYQLPSYSPDYNPIEKLWKKIKEKGTHLHYFPTFQDLKHKVEEMLFRFENATLEVLSLFGFYKELALAG
jgi:transposase